MKTTIFVMIALLAINFAQPASARTLTPVEIGRVEAIKAMIEEVEDKPVKRIIAELEKNDYPKLQIVMKEAMAKTYVDVIEEQKVRGKAKRVWLYSIVNLNMAYLQFVGTKHKAKDNPLNMLIRNKLRSYLPADIDDEPGFHQSVE